MKITGEKLFQDDTKPIKSSDTNIDTTTPKIKGPENGVDFTNFNPVNLDELVYQNYGKAANRLIPVGNTGVGDSQYDEGITLSQLGDLEGFRASKQSAAAQFTNAVLGGIGSGIVGIGENFSVLGDTVANHLGIMEDWEKSTLTENLQGAKDWINEISPIYKKDRSDTFDWDDSGFYFEMLKGAVDSAVAFGVAGAGYAGIMGKLAKVLGKTTLNGQRLNVLTRFAGSKLLKTPEIAKDLTQLGAAALSNYSEGTIMGLETYETEKEKLMEVGVRNRAMEIANEKGIHISDVQLSEDELHKIERYAAKEAGKAGDMMRSLNHMLIFSNMAQMQSIAGLKKFIGAGGSTVSRNMVKKTGAKEFWKGQLKGAPLEASEEIGQNVLQMESKYQSDLAAQKAGYKFKEEELESTSADFGSRLIEFATSDQALLEGMMGFISGPIQYGLTQAPFQKGQSKEQNKRYVTQKTLIGRNAKFIEDKLKQVAEGEDLAKNFEKYREEVLGKDLAEDTEESKAADAKRFEELIANTELDTLIQENFFNGTTQDLEDQLTEVANKEVKTEEDQVLVDNAKTSLERLNKLENRFTNYNKYINGAEIFAAELRGERIATISKDLEDSFKNREVQMTKDIRAAIEQEYINLYGDNFNGALSDLSNNFAIGKLDKDGKPDEETSQRVNSVSEIVDGIRNGYQIFQIIQDPNNKSEGKIKLGEKVLEQLDIVQKALTNQALLDNTKSLERKNRLFVNEAKTKTYQSLYSDFQDAMQSYDENDVNDMGLVKTNLEELLNDPRYQFKKGDKVIYTNKEKFNEGEFTVQEVLKNGNLKIKKNGNIIEVASDDISDLITGKYDQLKKSIESQLNDINTKIKQIESGEASLQEDIKNKAKIESADAAKNNKKGEAENVGGVNEGLQKTLTGGQDPNEKPVVTSPAGIDPDQIPEDVIPEEDPDQKDSDVEYYPVPNTILLTGMMQDVATREKDSKLKNYKFMNPATGQSEKYHTLRPKDDGSYEISFISDPDTFYPFIIIDKEDGLPARVIPSQKEYYNNKQKEKTVAITNPSKASPAGKYKVGDVIDFQDYKGFTVTAVLPNGDLKIKKNNKTITVKSSALGQTLFDAKADPDTEINTNSISFKKGDKVDYNGQQGYVVQKVLPNGNLMIKKNNRVIEVNPSKIQNNIALTTSSTKKPTVKKSTSKTPENQIDNKKPTKKVINKKKVDLDNIEPVITDTTASTVSMKKDLAKKQKEVDIITVNDEKSGTKRVESANVKTLDYNFNESNDDEFAKFTRNKQNKEGVPVLMSVNTSNEGLRLFSFKSVQVQNAINAYNKLKAANAINLDNWNKYLTEEEYNNLLSYLPVKFSLKDNSKVQSHMPIKSSDSLKVAEKKLRLDTINASLSGTTLERNIKGQGPGALNEIESDKISTFLNTDQRVNSAILHVSIGGVLVALDEINDDMFDEVFMGYTDANGNSTGWDGVFTIGAKDMAGNMFPIKLNTVNHSTETAEVVTSMLATLIDPQFKTQRGDVDNNVHKSKLKDVNPSAFEYIKNNIPSMLDAYGSGENITLGEALSDMIYYGKRTQDSFGHISIMKAGTISIGGAANANFRTQDGKPLNFTFADLQDPTKRGTVIKFIEDVKPFNVNAKKLKTGVNKTNYRKHVFSNYMETTVDLNTPFIKKVGKNPSGDPVQRYERAHLYISSLPVEQTAQQGVISNKQTPFSDIKNIKADIEKRKQQIEIEGYTFYKIDGTYDISDAIEGIVGERIDSLEKAVIIAEKLATLKYISQDEDGTWGSGLEYSFEGNTKQEVIDKINAKYNAELAALNQPTNPPADFVAEDNYKGVPLVNKKIVNNAGHVGGAKYDRTNNIIIVNDEVLQQKYKEKAWTKPYKQTDGSTALALSENAFTSYEEFKNFVIEHEYQHSVTSRAQYDKESPFNTTIGTYEDFINTSAAEALGLDIYKRGEKKPTPPIKPTKTVTKVQTSSSIKPVETKLNVDDKLEQAGFKRGMVGTVKILNGKEGNIYVEKNTSGTFNVFGFKYKKDINGEFISDTIGTSGQVNLGFERDMKSRVMEGSSEENLFNTINKLLEIVDPNGIRINLDTPPKSTKLSTQEIEEAKKMKEKIEKDTENCSGKSKSTKPKSTPNTNLTQPSRTSRRNKNK